MEEIIKVIVTELHAHQTGKHYRLNDCLKPFVENDHTLIKTTLQSLQQRKIIILANNDYIGLDSNGWQPKGNLENTEILAMLEPTEGNKFFDGFNTQKTIDQSVHIGTVSGNIGQLSVSNVADSPNNNSTTNQTEKTIQPITKKSWLKRIWETISKILSFIGLIKGVGVVFLITTVEMLIRHKIRF